MNVPRDAEEVEILRNMPLSDAATVSRNGSPPILSNVYDDDFD